MLQHGNTAMHKLALFASLAAIATAGIILAQVFSKALAQEHRHPPQDEAIHDKFYSTRVMPDRSRPDPGSGSVGSHSKAMLQ